MDALKLPFKFDTSRIKEELSQFSEADYDEIYNTRVKAETLWSMHFITPVGPTEGPHVFLPNKALEKCSYLLSILNTFKCDKETFRVHTLDPGAVIQPHKDNGYSIEHGKVRLHIPVITDDKVEIILNDELIRMKEGECWYCNFHLKHEVYNKSDKPRVHLIMDCMVNDWLKEIFKQSTTSMSLSP